MYTSEVMIDHSTKANRIGTFYFAGQEVMPLLI